MSELACSFAGTFQRADCPEGSVFNFLSSSCTGCTDNEPCQPVCSTVTPTETPTNTPTITLTPTVTDTPTETATPTEVAGATKAPANSDTGLLALAFGLVVLGVSVLARRKRTPNEPS